ncbi:MAG TPA: aminotransferase class IV [Thermoguttaceae bacterium]
MIEPQAYLNGNWIPASAAAVSVNDAGFVLGIAVAEQLRTFAGRIFRLDDHLDRLENSMQIVGVDSGLTRQKWSDIAQELVDRNNRFLTPGDDWGISISVTPGIYPSYSTTESARPTVCLHLYPLPFRIWAKKYRTGQALAATSIEQIPAQCWPPELKCRSRMHYYLADKLAAENDPCARAVLLDGDGFISESSTANVVIYRKGEGLLSPPLNKILHGISLAVVVEISGRLGVPFHYRDLTPADLTAADEIILTSTPLCLLPVTSFNSRPIGDGHPGEISRRLLAAWSEMVGLDIIAQAERFSQR